jgi:hypothetical protein
MGVPDVGPVHWSPAGDTEGTGLLFPPASQDDSVGAGHDRRLFHRYLLFPCPHYPITGMDGTFPATLRHNSVDSGRNEP